MPKAGGFTHVGKVRKINEDAFCVKDGFAIVSDGMGGHNKGEIASNMAISKMSDIISGGFEFSEDFIIKAIAETNSYIASESEKSAEYSGMGATLVCAMWQENEVIIANVGDSRGYLLSKGNISQITKDHSLVQTLVDSGKITKEQAKASEQKNIIYRAIGYTGADPDIFRFNVENGDTVILCSDGLTNMIEDNDILSLSENEKNPAKLAEKLANLANDKGGTDNITAVAVIF